MSPTTRFAKSLCVLSLSTAALLAHANKTELPQPPKLDPQLAEFCDGVGALTMAFAKLRDQGLQAWQARRKLRPLLTKNKLHDHRLANRVMAIPQALAYSNKTLRPLTLFAMGRFMCETTLLKIKYSTALPYFARAGELCQSKTKTDKALYGCMHLSYRLLLKEVVKLPKNE